MKKSGIILSSILVLSLVFTAADAQRGSNRGGGGRSFGGGGGRSFSGGSAGRSFSGGGGRSFGGGSFNRGGGSFNSGSSARVAPSRPAFNPGVRAGGVETRPTAPARSYARPGFTPPARSFAYNRPRGFYGGGGYYHGGGHYIGYYHGYRPFFYPRPYIYHPFYHPFRWWGPSIGFHLTVLPAGFYTIYTGYGPCYYADGIYYRNYNNAYEVVDAPVGSFVPTLPSRTEQIEVSGTNYYFFNGTFYYPSTDANGNQGYVIAGKNGHLEPADNSQEAAQATAAQQQQYDQQVTPTTAELPEGCREVTINGQTLFLSPDGMYYQQVNQGNGVEYQIVGKQAAN